MHNAQVVINKRLRSQSCYSLVVVHNVWKYSIIRLILQMVTRIHISFSLKDCRHFFSFLRKMHLNFHQVFHFWRNCTFLSILRDKMKQNAKNISVKIFVVEHWTNKPQSQYYSLKAEQMYKRPISKSWWGCSMLLFKWLFLNG